MVPFLDDEDRPSISLEYRSQDNVIRLASVRMNQSHDRLKFEVQHDAVVKYTAEEVRCSVSTEQVVGAIAASFGALISYRYRDDKKDPDGIEPSNTLTWFEWAMKIASPRTTAEELCKHTSVVLRSIAGAIGASPTSIKKEDVANAIIAWEDANPLPDIMPECEGVGKEQTTQPIMAVMGNGRKPAYYYYGNGPTGADSTEEALKDRIPFDQDCDDLGMYCFPSAYQVMGEQTASDMMVGWIEQCKQSIGNLQKLGLAQADQAVGLMAYQEQQIRSLQAWSHASMMEAREVVERSNTQMKAASEIIDSLRLVRAPKMTIEGDTMVEVCGRKFVFHGSGDAPLGIPNYCHDYWSASQRLGTGGGVVRFDAADLFDVVLNEIVTGMVGPPGVGKTSIVLHMGNTLGLPVHVIQFTKDKPIEQLIGVDKIRSGQQVFEDGEITVAMRAAANDPNTIHIIVFDEFDHAPSEVQSEFHGVVEGRPYTLPSGEVLSNHGNMRFVLTRNTSGHGDTTGRHAAANVSDSAFNSRIAASFNVDYMSAPHEAALMVVHGLEPDEAKKLVEFADKTRRSVASVDSGDSFDGMTEPVCLRHMISYCNSRCRGVDMKKALALCVVGQLPARDREVANELAINSMGIA